MNHVYRVVWNASLGIFQAVSEVASGHGSQGSKASRRRRRALRALSLAAMTMAATTQQTAWASALTVGVVGGQTIYAALPASNFWTWDGTNLTIPEPVAIAGVNYGVSSTGSISSLTNAGSISGTIDAINNAAAATITTLQNSGTIVGTLEGIANSGTIGTLSNSGAIGGMTAGIYNGGTAGTIATIGALSNSAPGYVTVLNNDVYGEIGGAAVATAISNSGTISSLTNAGTITGTVDGVLNNGSSGTIATIISLDNAAGGSISSVNNGQYGYMGSVDVPTTVNNAGTIGTLNNAGSIYGYSYAVVNTGSIGTLSNSGNIWGWTYAIQNEQTIGTIINSGVLTGTGIVIYNEGTIGSIVNSGTITGLTAAIVNTSTGSIGQITNTGLISGNIENGSTNALTIAGGTGTTIGTLTGYNGAIGAFTSVGDVVFSTGNQLLNDNITVGSGSGTVNNAGAVLGVNNAITITGNYSQGQAATLLVGVTSETVYGQLYVTGNTTITAGSSIQLTTSNGYGFAANQRYVVIDTAGSATYNASTLNYSIAGYNASVSGVSESETNGHTDLVVTIANLTGGGSSNRTVAQTASQSNAVSALTGLLSYAGSTNAQLLNLYDATLAELSGASNSTANKIGNQLSPVRTQTVGATPTLDAMGVVGSHLDALRVAQVQGGSGVATGDSPLQWTGWGQAFGGHASQSQRDGVSGYSANYAGLLVGADRAIGDNWRVGAAFNYSNTATNYSDDQSGDSASVNAFGLMGYASYQGAPWYVNGSAAVATQRYRTTRVISMPGYEGMADGSYSGQQYAARVEAGWPLALPENLTLTPLASLTYSHLNQNGYTETGGNGAALSVGSSSSNSVRSALGVKLEKAFETTYGVLVPEFRIQWIHEYDRTRQSTVASFSGAPDETSFTTSGATPVSNLAEMSLGVTLVRANNLSLSARYVLDAGAGYVSQTGIVRLQQKF